MIVGDRVRVKRPLAQAMAMNTRGQHRKKTWIERVGSIIAVHRPDNATDDITIQWDDRRTPDHWPERALELIE